MKECFATSNDCMRGCRGFECRFRDERETPKSNNDDFKATDNQIAEWAKTHDLEMYSISDQRCMFEDARSYHLKH